MEHVAEVAVRDVRQVVAASLRYRDIEVLSVVPVGNDAGTLGTVIGFNGEHMVAAVEAGVAANFVILRRGEVP